MKLENRNDPPDERTRFRDTPVWAVRPASRAESKHLPPALKLTVKRVAHEMSRIAYESLRAELAARAVAQLRSGASPSKVLAGMEATLLEAAKRNALGR